MGGIWPSNYNIITDLISPWGIALVSIALTYVISTIASTKTKQEELKSRRIYYIDFLMLELKKIETALNSLLSDLDKGNAEFQLTNVTSINNAASEIKRMIPEVIIIPDESLREKIINFIDSVSDLALGIQALENIKGQWLNEFNGANSGVQYELKSLKTELLKLDIGINDRFKPITLKNNKITGEQRKYIMKLVSDINSKSANAVTDWKDKLVFCKDKRIVFSTRILDVKSSLNDLSIELNDLKGSISKRKLWFLL